MTVKERPILFNGPMVRAILAGKKTQTRRIIKPQPIQVYEHYYQISQKSMLYGKSSFFRKMIKKCPCGQPGDMLWVRETFEWDEIPGHENSEYCEYKATSYVVPCDGWTPSIHMPRWASRITLMVTDVRIEKLQDMTEEDAKAEGIREVKKDGINKYCIYDKRDYSSEPWQDMPQDPVTVFQRLWDSINAKQGFGWNTNPWVWIVEFKRVS